MKPFPTRVSVYATMIFVVLALYAQDWKVLLAIPAWWFCELIKALIEVNRYIKKGEPK